MSNFQKFYLAKVVCLCCFVILFASRVNPQSAASKPPPYLSKLEYSVVREINLARQYPKQYADFLEKLKRFYDGALFKRPGEITIVTKEGVRALNEAIRFLHKVKPLRPVRASKGMSRAARGHVNDQGPTGRLDHEGTDGSQVWDRVSRYGKWRITVGENIAYGEKTARDIVIGLIVDDGVPNRGHRKNIFNPEYRVIGVAFGYHKKYRTMCVVDFAGGFEEK